MDPALFCRIFFICGTAISLGGTFISSFQSQIMAYGFRSTYKSNHYRRLSLPGVFNKAASLRVPHAWFAHYYLASLASSLAWAIQFFTYGTGLRFLASISKTKNTTLKMNQILLAWLFMTIQGARRLWECITLTKKSQSQMWAGIWILGICFYFVMGIAVWIDGIALFDRALRLEDLLSMFSEPTFKTLIALVVFLTASLTQHVCHKHLYNLKKYSVPHHRIFQRIVCPHYTCECFIYLSITLVSAPRDQIFNSTVFTGLCFVISNLAVTANGTLKWYREKFGTEQVKAKWRMVPFFY